MHDTVANVRRGSELLPQTMETETRLDRKETHGEEKMPCYKEHGELEVEGVVQVVVVDDDRRTKHYPYGNYHRCRQLRPFVGVGLNW